MDEYKVTESRRMKFDGVFSMSNYYRVLYDVFRSMNYDVYEIKYAHKMTPDGSEELEIVWSCIKDIDNYSRIRIHAKTLVVGMKRVQVPIEGVNVGREQAACELEIAGYVETDYLNKWEADPFLKHLKWFYDTYLYREMFRYVSNIAATQVYAVENEVKAFFNMQKML